ncbi:hypothetical protein B0T39_03465 [Chromobacterium haemolyticum]|nr:hypothetical protein B0T39_03465 [Chromobacterium haemolyticum]
MMILIAGAARRAGRGICSAKFPFTPKAALQAWPAASRRVPSGREARLNSQRANVALLEQAAA